MQASDLVKGGLAVMREALGRDPEKMARDPAPDAIDLLLSQHREVEDLFTEFFRLGEHAEKTKQRLIEQIIAKLELHTRLEERVFYRAATEVDEAMVLESVEAHDLVKYLIKRIRSPRGAKERMQGRVILLKELFARHVDDEENRLFPEVRGALGSSELKALGARMHRLVNRHAPNGTRMPSRRMAQARAAATKSKTRKQGPNTGKGKGKARRAKRAKK